MDRQSILRKVNQSARKVERETGRGQDTMRFKDYTIPQLRKELNFYKGYSHANWSKGLWPSSSKKRTIKRSIKRKPRKTSNKRSRLRRSKH